VGLEATLEALSRHVPAVPLVAIPRASSQAAVARLAALLA